MPPPDVEHQIKAHPAPPAAKRAYALALQAGRARAKWLKAHAGQQDA